MCAGVVAGFSGDKYYLLLFLAASFIRIRGHPNTGENDADVSIEVKRIEFHMVGTGRRRFWKVFLDDRLYYWECCGFLAERI